MLIFILPFSIGFLKKGVKHHINKLEKFKIYLHLAIKN